MPEKCPPSAVGDADDDDRSPTVSVGGRSSVAARCGAAPASCGHAHRRLRPRALLRPLGVRRRAPALRVGRAGLADGRRCSPWPTTRRRALWDGLRLGYAESTGHPLLRREIAALYDGTRARRRPRLRRRRGGDLLPRQRAARARATTPSSRGPATRACTRSPGRPARTSPSTSCARTPAGRSISSVLRRQVTPATRAHRRQRAAQPDRDAARPRDLRRRSSPIAEDAGVHLLLDEVYRYLEFDAADRLPAGADAMPRGVSLGVMSKSFAMAGLRIGWLATRDRELLDRCARSRTTRRSAPRRRRRCSRSSGFAPATASWPGRAGSSPTTWPPRRLLRGVGRPLHLGPPAGRIDRRFRG